MNLAIAHLVVYHLMCVGYLGNIYQVK